MRKQRLFLILILTMGISMLVVGRVKETPIAYAATEIANGTYADTFSWVLDSEGTITLSGEGQMFVGDISKEIIYPITWNEYSDFIKKVVINEGITTLRIEAFSNCKNLTTVSLPKGFIKIGAHAFSGCSSLTDIDLPEGLIEIMDGAFSGCSSLTHVDIPESVTTIGGGIFAKCSSLTNIVIPRGITIIESSMFGGCSNLTNITLHENITEIGEWAFNECYSLTHIDIPENVITIGKGAFDSCKSLTTINVPKGVTVINCFGNCSNLENINIPEGVTKIEEFAFSGCISLKTLNLPSTVTSIGQCAFSDCYNLKSINIPERITSIEYGTFEDCIALTEIYVPSAITDIGEYAFNNCENLDNIYFYGNAPYIRENSFKNVTANAYYSNQTNGWDATVKNNYGGILTWLTWAEAEFPFWDVKPTKWYYETIKAMYKLGYMTGTSAECFNPEGYMSRAMVVSVLHRMSGKPKVTYQALFTDVAAEKWYTMPVIWAATNNIVSGFSSDNTFRPNTNITREQVAVIIRNYVKSLGIDTTVSTDLTTFKDYDKISSWSNSAIAWAVENRIMSGTQEGTLRPQGHATRAECAKMLLKAYELIEENK